MDMLLAANALARHAKAAEHRTMSSAEENRYYAKHTLNVIVPRWVVGLVELFRHGQRSLPGRVRPARLA